MPQKKIDTYRTKCRQDWISCRRLDNNYVDRVLPKEEDLLEQFNETSSEEQYSDYEQYFEDCSGELGCGNYEEYCVYSVLRPRTVITK